MRDVDVSCLPAVGGVGGRWKVVGGSSYTCGLLGTTWTACG